jgi:kynurenine formamidase
MIAAIHHKTGEYKIDISKPVDISIPLREGKENVNAFNIPPLTIEPLRSGSFTGSVAEGGSCNVNTITFNPHGNGTHTECAGHISKETFTINQSLKDIFVPAQVITVTPEKTASGDLIIQKHQVENVLKENIEGVVLRTLPNPAEKINRQYSGTNPAYLHHEAAKFLAERNINHLLLDVPSVDRENDGGKLLAHHAFWRYPRATRVNATITELIYVPDEIKDGTYFLMIQIAPFENDASPSKPLLFKIV